MKKVPISLLVGLIAVLVTIILYFVILGNVILEVICLITLFGVVVAELITTAFAYLSKGNPRKVAAAVVSAAMIPASVILSIVYITGFPYAYGTYIAIYVCGLLIVNAIALVLFVFESNKTEENEKFQSAKDNMLNLRKLVKCILVDENAADYKDALNSIEEKLHFSEDNVIAPQDSEIYSMLVELQSNISNPEYDTEKAIASISKTIDLRNILSKKTV